MHKLFIAIAFSITLLTGCGTFNALPSEVEQECVKTDNILVCSRIHAKGMATSLLRNTKDARDAGTVSQETTDIIEGITDRVYGLSNVASGQADLVLIADLLDQVVVILIEEGVLDD